MKIKKMIVLFLIMLSIGCSLMTTSYAREEGAGAGAGTGITIGGKDISAFKPSTLTDSDTEKAFKLGETIISGLTTVGVVVSVIMVIILGIKYMVGSLEEKAEYKKTMLPMLIGAVVIFSASIIVSVLYQLVYTGVFLKS